MNNAIVLMLMILKIIQLWVHWWWRCDDDSEVDDVDVDDDDDDNDDDVDDGWIVENGSSSLRKTLSRRFRVKSFTHLLGQKAKRDLQQLQWSTKDRGGEREQRWYDVQIIAG